MANCCCYDLRVVGERKNVREFYDAMRRKGIYAEGGVGRVYSCYLTNKGPRGTGRCFMDLAGDCAWSIYTAMRNEDNPNSLEAISKRLSLTIEVFSAESGFEFMEHFLVDSGSVKADECVDYHEIYVADTALSDLEINLLKKFDIPMENYLEYAEEGIIRLGGMEVCFQI